MRGVENIYCATTTATTTGDEHKLQSVFTYTKKGPMAKVYTVSKRIEGWREGTLVSTAPVVSNRN